MTPSKTITERLGATIVALSTAGCECEPDAGVTCERCSEHALIRDARREIWRLQKLCDALVGEETLHQEGTYETEMQHLQAEVSRWQEAWVHVRDDVTFDPNIEIEQTKYILELIDNQQPEIPEDKPTTSSDSPEVNSP